METGSCEQLSESPNNENGTETTETETKEYCRLRDGLNEYCLLKVFAYLPANDLMKLCDMDPYFEELILKFTVKTKMFRLGNLDSNANQYEKKQQTRIMETFGKYMTKFKISTNSLTRLYETIIEYCEPAMLTEIDIEITADCTDDDIPNGNHLLLITIRPFLSNLRKLRLVNHGGNVIISTKFLILVSLAASNLQTLKLSNVQIRGKWLESMLNLRDLRVGWKEDSVLDSLLNCLRVNPKLKSFKFYHRSKYITTIGNVLSESCTGLEKFKDRDFENDYDRLDKEVINRYNFLSTFPYLSNVSLTSFTLCGCDLYYPLTTLATKKIVKLNIFMSYSQRIILDDETTTDIMRRPLPHFPDLKSIKVEIYDQYGDEQSDPKWRECDVRCKFLFHFVAQLKNLQHFKFAGDCRGNMHKILEFAPSIRTLDVVDTVAFTEANKLVPDVVRTVRANRLLNGGINDQHVLHLIVNWEYKVGISVDYEDVVRISFGMQKL